LKKILNYFNQPPLPQKYIILTILIEVPYGKD